MLRVWGYRQGGPVGCQSYERRFQLGTCSLRAMSGNRTVGTPSYRHDTRQAGRLPSLSGGWERYGSDASEQMPSLQWQRSGGGV